MVELNDPIQAGVLFAGSQVRPVWFRWRGRTVRVQKVTFRWCSMQGRERLSHFSVTDGTNLFELTFHAQGLTWRLTKADGF